MVLLDLTADSASAWGPLIVTVVLLVALVLLWFSMRRHLKRADYPDAEPIRRTRGGPSAPASPGDDR